MHFLLQIDISQLQIDIYRLWIDISALHNFETSALRILDTSALHLTDISYKVMETFDSGQYFITITDSLQIIFFWKKKKKKKKKTHLAYLNNWYSDNLVRFWTLDNDIQQFSFLVKPVTTSVSRDTGNEFIGFRFISWVILKVTIFDVWIGWTNV